MGTSQTFCSSILIDKINLVWMSFLLTFEMFIVSIITTFIFRPSQTAFFDKFTKPNRPSNRISTANNNDNNDDDDYNVYENDEHTNDTYINSNINNNNNNETNNDINTNNNEIRHRPTTSDTIRSINQVEFNDSINMHANGNESGIESASTSSSSTSKSNSIYDNRDEYKIETTKNIYENLNSEVETRINDNDLTEINLDSSRSIKSDKDNIEKF